MKSSPKSLLRQPWLFPALALFAAVVVVVVWIGTPPVIEWLDGLHGYPELDRFARWGDALGGVGVLFSGLAFLAVAAALAFEVRERRRDLEDRKLARRPFVTFQSPAVELSFRMQDPPPNSASAVDARVHFTNGTAEPALNVCTSIQLVDVEHGVQSPVYALMPLLLDAAERTTNTVRLERTTTSDVIRRLQPSNGDPGLLIEVSIVYSSLEDKKWRTSFRARAKFASEDDGKFFSKAISKASQPSQEDEGVFSRESVSLEYFIEEDSWSNTPFSFSS